MRIPTRESAAEARANALRRIKERQKRRAQNQKARKKK